MGRHGFPGIPRRFGMQLPLVAMVLREASALMRISSIYIYIYVCHASAHAQDNNNYYYLYIRAMGRHGFPGIFPVKVWHAAAFRCNGSARGICADAYI